MRKQTLSLILLLMIFLSGCGKFFNDVPQLGKPVERCIPNIKKVEDGLYKGYCRCHLYEVTVNHVGRVGDSENKPLEYCHGAAAFPRWAKIKGWFDELMQYIRDNEARLRAFEAQMGEAQ